MEKVKVMADGTQSRVREMSLMARHYLSTVLKQPFVRTDTALALACACVKRCRCDGRCDNGWDGMMDS